MKLAAIALAAFAATQQPLSHQPARFFEDCYPGGTYEVSVCTEVADAGLSCSKVGDGGRCVPTFACLQSRKEKRQQPEHCELKAECRTTDGRWKKCRATQ